MTPDEQTTRMRWMMGSCALLMLLLLGVGVFGDAMGLSERVRSYLIIGPMGVLIVIGAMALMDAGMSDDSGWP